MPNNNHELPLELFRERPELAPKIAREVLKLPVPDKLCWRLGPETVTALGPLELRLDVSLVGATTDKPEYAIIQEVQNSCASRELDRIRASWPEYVTNLRKRLKCPVVLLAYCPNKRVAAKVGQPVETGHPGFVFAPVTYWPGKLPAVTDPVTAEQWPELVVLSAPGHLGDTERHDVLESVLQMVTTFGEERGFVYYDYVSAQLPEAARLELEKIMTISIDKYEWKSDFALRHQAIGHTKGLAEGEAKAILTVLETRGIEIDDATRERVLGCSNLEQLKQWVRRAVQVSTASELFD
ncbi:MULTISPECIES: hypothetical protein [unclassified Nocardia]|uniref:hypothetical protein n=1 Tax=unclassified Nocardia TaxID=2637762 RepID=UPI001CE46D0F|nr:MULTISPECIES: hypothetical protein [unclassified Nocardia]